MALGNANGSLASAQDALDVLLDAETPDVDSSFFILGSLSTDAVTASDESNWIFSFGGDDKINAGAGDDWVVGGSGNDTLLGDAGDDILSGGLGHDVVYGGVGEDVLYGGWGNDTIVGGEGSDSLWGGLGNDAFVFDSLTTSSDADRIQDFRLGDIIALDQDVFSGLGLGRLKAENFVNGEGAVCLLYTSPSPRD